VALPPAASIFSLADAENASAVTFTATEISPVPEHLDRVAVTDRALGDEVGDGDLAALGVERR
jgi:hypothetical protein